MPTPALLAVGLLLAPAPDDLEQRVEKALDRARPALLSQLRRADGGPLALLCLAAAHDRVPRGNRVFAAALQKLARADLRDTYGLALRLMVAAHVETFPHRAEIVQRDTQSLLLNQARGGGFSYTSRPSHWDLSNTQYAALGLRAAVYLQQDVPLHVWEGLARAARANQDSHGGFGYASRGGATMSMTVAGIAILELCRQRFVAANVAADPIEAGIERGWSWMDEHAGAIGELGAMHALYAHYGLERAAVLSSRGTVGGEDWYRRGAEPILRLQLRSGGFPAPQSPQSGVSQVDTAFAVLFLRRAFQRELVPSGPVTPGPNPLCHQLPEDADEDAIRKAVECDVDRGDAAVPDLLAALRSPVEARRRAAAHALLRISGVDFRYHPARTETQNAAAILRAERWWAERSRGRRP